MQSPMEGYKEFLKNRKSIDESLAFGFGIRRSKNKKTLDVWYPIIAYDKISDFETVFEYVCHLKKQNGFEILDFKKLEQAISLLEALEENDELSAETKQKISFLKDCQSRFSYEPDSYADIDFIYFAATHLHQSVETPEEAYFKLHLLSHTLISPQGLNVEGIFSKLNNVAWTNYGPMLPEDVSALRLKYYFHERPLLVSHVDKFPYLVNYHLPKGVRIADASRARLGAHLAEGTTIMPAGYVNFNAGSMGHSMIEGRVSAGVKIAEGTDIGGGASIMGTLSGGGEQIVSLGKNCLLGANSGVGIALGDGCTVAAGVYITAGAKVFLYDEKNQPVNIQGQSVAEGKNIVKAKDLHGRDFLLFLQDSVTGRVICKPNQKQIELNAELHKN